MSTRFSTHLPESGVDPRRRPEVDVADLVDESVAVFGLDMQVTAWNTAAERLYEWPRADVIGGRIQAAVRCSPSEPLASILEQVLATGSWRGEFRRTKRGGSSVIVEAKWSLRRDPSGDPVDIVETSRDVSEARRTEEALRRVQYQYQNLFQASAASFWELDFSEVGAIVRSLLGAGVTDLRAFLRANPDETRRLVRATRIVDVNEQSLVMFGNGDRAALMRGLDPLWPDESLNVFAESVVAAFEQRAHYSSEAVFEALDGRRYETLFTVSYPPQRVQSARLLVGIIDVTHAKQARAAQQRSEQRYNDFFHFLPVALCQLDGRKLVELMKEARALGVVHLDTYLEDNPAVFHRATEGLRLVEVNARMVDLLRAGSAEALVGRTITRYWTESAAVLRASMSARYSGEKGFQAQIKIRADDGAVIDALYFAAFAPVTGDDGVSLVGLIDVSDRVSAQETLAKLQSEIAHAARISVLGELTASIAHEVNQPLTAIQTNTEASLLWLGRSPPNLPEVRKLAERTASQVQRAAEILQRIRSMAERRDPDQAVIDLRTLIEEASLFLSHELQRHDVEIRLQVGRDIPPVIGDRVQLQQVVVNLAINGIQAMSEARSPSRVLTINSSVLASGEVVVSVEDTGPGIPGEALPRLFEGFFTTKKTGMGIGLPICRSIIEALGGKISVTNRDDRTGARVSFTLPPHPGVHPNV